MAKSSRRKFLKIGSVAAASLAVSNRIPSWASQASHFAPVSVWRTYEDRKYERIDSLAWKNVTDITGDTIVLNPSATRQEILGFGAALTDASCFVLSQLRDEERKTLMQELFAPGEMALNVCQSCIGSSDYSRSVYSFDESDQPDLELKNFSIEHDRSYILPMLRESRKLNPEIFLFATPWSPPGWMKSGGSMLGGSMRKQYYEPYANYFLKFLDAYKAEGIQINAVAVQNEVDTDQNGRMPACLWGQEYEIEFVKEHLGPLLRKSGSPTKIWVVDHNYNLWGRAIGELSDHDAYEFIDGIAWHGYSGKPSDMTRVHDAFPLKNAYWTEGGPDITAPDYLTDWAKWAETFNGVLNNWARSITAWNLALDEHGQPNLGQFPCGGVVTIDNATHKVTHSGQYWAIAHYSKHVRRGARVFGTDGSSITKERAATVSHAGFRNPDGSFVVTLANRGSKIRVKLLLGNSALEIELPTDSVHTLQWS
jgi:glucosylceramidase